VESKSREEQDEFRRQLKEEWRLIWWERFDDRVKGEGVAVRDYPLIFMDRGFVVFASRNAKMPSFSEIARVWVSRGCMYSPDPRDGGWGKFIRTEVRKPVGSRAKAYRSGQCKRVGKKGQLKKGGRGWLHVE
jgi:hypothetical protein